jgi:tRNA threonylcarbamoyladenosine biosynthesis protein TsaB
MHTMIFAALETSTDWCSAALWLDGESVALEERAGNRHAERLLPMLDELCARAGVKPDALQAVAYGAGPGSFTGLRIACGVTQGVAMARNLPVLGIPTLHALAEESGASQVVACLDARMGEVYYSALRKQGRGWVEEIPVQCVPPAQLRMPQGAWTGCGNGFAAYGNMGFDTVLPEVHPTASAVARLAAPRLAAGEGVDAALAAPLYVRDKVAFTTEERAAGR